ncbi:retrovirus-related pol polyprotein from transposon TNT 1-94 [Tanacetum coccineum]
MAKQAKLKNRMRMNSSQREIWKFWNNVQRVNHKNKFVPTTVLTRTSKIPVNTARASGTNNVSTGRHNLNRQAVPSNGARKVNTVKPIVNNDKANIVKPMLVLLGGNEKLLLSRQQVVLGDQKGITGKKSPNIMVDQDLEIDYPHRALKNKGIVDSGCSKHMTGNKAYLAEYQDFNGGLVAFGGSKGYITGKGGLACLIAKATIDGSNKWHRRLGHVNFKNLNKLVKGNLVRGFTSKDFSKMTTIVLLSKGKQHKASCKAKSVSSISHSLQLLHMDLFRPTSVRSLNHKTYCLVITVDFSRFSWVFFLRTKDETSRILKDFIRQIENQLNQKVKTIRCDNGTEFKNMDFIEFCGSKGIKREYSNARTPQQNGVAERKNRTLIEAARTMLADSFLPNTFWAEAVSTACYVLNRVLVTKPHNKTPYELVTGKIPIISYIRPFGCHVTILNTIDHLGKFDGKSDEGFLVGYSLQSKAFRVLRRYHNAVKRSTEKDAGEAPTKHPDLQTDEKPVDKEDQVFLDELKRLKRQEKDVNDAAEALRKEFAQETKNLLLQAGAAKASSTNIVNTVSTPVSTARPSDGLSFSNPTNPDQDDSEIPALEDIYKNPTDGIFTNSSYDDECAVADFTNLELVVNVSPIPTSRINFIHPSTLILGDPQSAVQTRSKVTKSSRAHAFVSYIQKQRRYNHKDFQHCLFACFLSQNEPKKISKALEDESWVDAMQEELNKKDERGVVVRNKARLVAQGHRQEEGIDYDEVFAPVARIEAIRIFLAFASYMGFIVYQDGCKCAFFMGKKNCFFFKEVYVSQPLGFIDPKYPQKVYKVVKALYGLHQAPRAWYATLSTFLLKNGYKRGTIDKTLFIKKDKHDIILVQVYVDDIIFGSTKKSWCDEFEALMQSRFQMSSMGELTFFLGLQVKQKEDGIFISQDKYVAEILKKFDFVNVKTASTPIETQKPLVKDEEASNVDVHLYRSMIGSLMYLTASRPDIMFAVCACSRFQVTPKSSHLSVVKRIFRYLKGKPKLGLWYPRVSSFDLESYSDSDYAGANLDRKSTTGGCQFLGRRLISWQCKKQTIVATSTTEAEYVAAASCCGQVLWIQNQMLDYGFNFMNTKIYIDNESTICIVKNPVYHSKTKHIAIRHHFIRDAYEKKLIQVLKIHTDDNVADLLTKAFDVSRESLRRVFDGTEALLLPTLFILWLATVSTNNADLVPLGKVCTAIETLKKNTAKALISLSTTITLSNTMVVLESCPKHNMVVYLEKTEGNAEFYEIIDLLTRSSIHHALIVSLVVSTTFVEQFWTSAKSKIINNVRNITAKVAGKPVSISEASIRNAKKKFVMYPRFVSIFLDKRLANVPVPLDHFPVNALTSKVFSFMVKKDKHFSGKVTPLFASMLVQPTEDEGAPSERPSEAQPTPSHTHTSEKFWWESWRSSQGNSSLEGTIKKLISKTNLYHTAPSMDEDGRKSAKAEPSVHKDPLFDEIPEDTLDYMETEDAQNWNKNEVDEEKNLKMYLVLKITYTAQAKGTMIKLKEKLLKLLKSPTSTIFEMNETRAQVLTQHEPNQAFQERRRRSRIGSKRQRKKKIKEKMSLNRKSAGIPEAEKKLSSLPLMKKWLEVVQKNGRKFLAQQRSEATKNNHLQKNPTEKSNDDLLNHARNFKHSNLKTKNFEEIQALMKRLKDSEIMEKKSVIARLNKVSSPDGDYLVIYRANGNFRAFNYLMEIMWESSTKEITKWTSRVVQQDARFVTWRLMNRWSLQTGNLYDEGIFAKNYKQQLDGAEKNVSVLLEDKVAAEDDSG